MKRRNLAFFSTISLLAIFIAGLTGLYFHYKSQSEQRQLYEIWLRSAEKFSLHATLAHQERSRYTSVKETWEALPKQVPFHEGHPARLFQRSLQNLYERPAPDRDAWLTSLREETQKLSSVSSVENALSSPPTEHAREWSLIFSFIARSHLRSVGDSCRPVGELHKGFRYYNAVSSAELELSKANGLGTVSACRMLLLLEPRGTMDTGEVSDWIPTACLSVRECFMAALREYRYAASKSEECSFRDKRFRNNRLDLYLKLGLYFETARTALGFPPYRDQLISSQDFAKAIQAQLQELVRCTQSGDFVPVTFLSAAQACGVIAGILEPSDEKRLSALKNAARYLRFSFAWLPAVTYESNFSYFCSALEEDGDLNKDFVESYSTALPWVESYPEANLRQNLQSACGATHG